MVQLVKRFIGQYFKSIYSQTFQHYLEYLANQLNNINHTIQYLQTKKKQLQLIIDKQTLALENKYIEVMEQNQIKMPQNIYCIDVHQIKENLNQIEKEYAELETYVLRLNEDKAYTKNQCDVLEALINAY
ncbi:hypothetical protein [Staphylococcus canis]|uniref:Staphylococcal protein n=1 Tax=Staphylococcus canis TaxID=2724942 RepID=A0ABS0TAD3_9STAP|nr:hypothetical protein [Staphylococcus canis]MBI5974734.1 hypothetical protein [Staphylococcus canis]